MRWYGSSSRPYRRLEMDEPLSPASLNRLGIDEGAVAPQPRRPYHLWASLACLGLQILAVGLHVSWATRDSCAYLGMNCSQLLLQEIRAMLPLP